LTAGAAACACSSQQHPAKSLCVIGSRWARVAGLPDDDDSFVRRKLEHDDRARGDDAAEVIAAAATPTGLDNNRPVSPARSAADQPRPLGGETPSRAGSGRSAARAPAHGLPAGRTSEPTASVKRGTDHLTWLPGRCRCMPHIRARMRQSAIRVDEHVEHDRGTRDGGVLDEWSGIECRCVGAVTCRRANRATRQEQEIPARARSSPGTANGG
jgi:hypothetical protein